jgi:hypothetical protein
MSSSSIGRMRKDGSLRRALMEWVCRGSFAL